MGSATFLLFCTLTIFKKLGSVVFVVTLLSIFAALGPLVAALIIFGPLNPGWSRAGLLASMKSTGSGLRKSSMNLKHRASFPKGVAAAPTNSAPPKVSTGSLAVPDEGAPARPEGRSEAIVVQEVAVPSGPTTTPSTAVAPTPVVPTANGVAAVRPAAAPASASPKAAPGAFLGAGPMGPALRAAPGGAMGPALNGAMGPPLGGGGGMGPPLRSPSPSGNATRGARGPRLGGAQAERDPEIGKEQPLNPIRQREVTEAPGNSRGRGSPARGDPPRGGGNPLLMGYTNI